MPPAIALAANLELATPALTVFLWMNATSKIDVYVRWFYPFTATFSRTVYAILGGIFLIFLIPFHFKLGIKQPIHVLEWYMVLCTAPRWHVLRVGNRHCEDSFQAIMAHMMTAAKLRGLRARDIVGETCKTLNSAR